MEGKRNQGVLHKYLTEAAEEVMTKGLRLSERLYVPEPFDETKKEEIAERRRRKLAVLQRTDADAQLKMALVLGEFKGSDVAAGGRRIWIKHMPGAPLLVDLATWKRIERVYGSLLEARDADTTYKARVMMCGLIYAKREHIYQLDTASFMLTTRQWIPIEGVHELEMISLLVEQKRSFVKPLRYDAKSASVFPNALLLDTGSTATPLHVISGFMHPRESALKLLALKTDGDPPWVWQTGETMPPLPRCGGGSGTHQNTHR
jgi:hypothetical protein